MKNVFVTQYIINTENKQPSNKPRVKTIQKKSTQKLWLTSNYN